MQNRLFSRVAAIFIFTGLYCGKGISAEIEAYSVPVTQSFDVNYGYHIYSGQTGIKCSTAAQSNKLSLIAHYTHRDYSVPCDGSTTWSGAGTPSDGAWSLRVTLINEGINNESVYIEYGKHGTNAQWASFHRSIPGRSTCGLTYEPTVKIGDMTPGYAPSPVRVLGAGAGNGQMSLRPISTDSYGSFISNSDGKKIYMAVKSTEGENWNNVNQVWEGTNKQDYYLHLHAPARDSEGVYEGIMQVSLTCL